jgi:penicillin-binding protein 1B
MAKKKSRAKGFLARNALRIAFVVMVLFVAAVGVLAYNYVTITRKFDTARQWDLPSRIYSDATPIVPGLSYPKTLLEPKLNHVGYHAVSGRVQSPGEYRWEGNALEIYLQPFRYPDVEFHGMAVRVNFRGSTVSNVVRIDDNLELRAVRVEPELVTSLFNDVMEDRLPVPLDSVSPHLVDAVVAAEDRQFFRHEGISIRGIVRAALENFRSREVRSGGSTITQQLVKNLYLTNERTYRRKMQEALMAIVLEARFSKKEILEAYLNEIYLGQSGAAQIVGVERASQIFFGKKAEYLTLPEAATIAAVIRYPNGYSPLRHPQRATERRNLVLRAMQEEEMITAGEYEEAVKAPLKVNPYHRGIRSAPYFVDLVLKELRETYPETQLKTEGLRIFTTLDTVMQRAAEESLTEGIEQLNRSYAYIRKADAPLQGSVLTIQPGTGYVKALVGGADYSKTQFNRAFQAKRQPGSLFKPFVYVAAMDPQRGRQALTASSILDDSPISIATGGRQWQPQNYDKSFRGEVSVRRALAYSYNIPAVRAAMDAGMPNVIELASTVGVQSRLQPYPSVSLGSFEVTPMEIAYAYSVFANEGVKAEPVSILAVATRDGRVLEHREVKMRRVSDPATVYVLNDMLKDVLRYGTAARVRSMGFDRSFAGKTGTTNDYRDAWFVAYSPRILTLVWVGFDDNRSTRLSGSAAAVPIWASYMKKVVPLVPDVEFRKPDGVVERTIDTKTGLLATPLCPTTAPEVYVSGTEPSRSCDLHAVYSESPYPWLRGERGGWRDRGDDGGLPPEERASAEDDAEKPEEREKKKKRGLRKVFGWVFD